MSGNPINNWDHVCSRMAYSTNTKIFSVDYRLSPENKFPCALNDCYAATKFIY